MNKKNIIIKFKNGTSGITLIALIVTVIVMLILAGVGIVFSVGDEGVITKSKLAKQEIESAEQNDRDLAGETLEYPNKTDNCKHKETETRNATGTYTGDIYCTNCGVLLATGGIIECENHPSTTVNAAVAATCHTKGNTGDTVCTVCGVVVTPGTEIDYNTSNHTGGTEVRNESDSYTGDTYCLGCGGLISRGVYDSPPVIGDYVNYDVTYTDINTGYEFTSADGWRLLYTPTQNSDGTYDITFVSTGLPAYIAYYYSNSYSWYGTYEQINEEYGLSLTSWTSDKSGYFASYGLKYNLNKVPLLYKKLNGKTSGTLYGSTFWSTSINVDDIHVLRLDELNKARGYGSSSTTAVKTKDADTGLFYLNNLENENTNFGYTKSSTYDYSYWLATPYYEAAFGYRGMRDVVIKVTGTYQGTISHYIGFDSTTPGGVQAIRPVVTISNVTLIYEDGVWCINQ